MRSYSEGAYAAVAKPVEGTILTVASAAAEGATATGSDDLGAVAMASEAVGPAAPASVQAIAPDADYERHGEAGRGVDEHHEADGEHGEADRGNRQPHRLVGHEAQDCDDPRHPAIVA